MTTPGRADLVHALNELVAASGLDRPEIGRRTGISKASLSRYLNPAPGKGVGVVPSPERVRSIIAATGQAGTEAAATALQLAEDLPSGNAGRVVVLRGGTATSQRKYAEAEAGTKHVREFTVTMPSGLLQTEPYMRAVFRDSSQTPDQQATNVIDRLRRQERLDDPAHRFTLLTTEGALRHHVDSPAVMVELCAAISRRARSDTAGRVRIGLIPWWRPRAVFPMTNFTMYDDRQVVIGTGFGTAFLDQAHDISVYVRQFEQLCKLALWDDAAAIEVDRIADDYRRLPDL